ncbi:MAG: hypothetical protein M0R80_12810 [Proteobacteria bacterium]|jgi:hypothetical protein|nr:hypothetical protein [Pseudomonadota bacterium]
MRLTTTAFLGFAALVPAADPDTQALAIAQLDFALLRGMAILERQKLVELGCATLDYRDAAMEGGADLVDVDWATTA